MRRRRSPVLIALFFCALTSLMPAASRAQEPVTAQPTTPSLLPDPWWLSLSIETARKFRVNVDGKDESTREWKPGVYFDVGSLVTGSGFLGVGVGYRQRLAGTPVRLDVVGHTTYRAYKMFKVQSEVPDLLDGRLDVGTRSTWRDYTQVNTFGIGPDSRPEDQSAYRLRAIDTVGYATFRPRPNVQVLGELGYMGRIRVGRPIGWTTTGFFAPEDPDAALTFPDLELLHVAPNMQPRYLHGHVSVAVDTRDQPRFPQEGAFYRAGWSTYADVKLGRFSFNRLELEALKIVPFGDGLWRLVGYGALVSTFPRSGNDVPFYLMPAIGGGETLKAYPSLRFADRHAAILRMETRLALFPHLDLAGFGEIGGVAPRLSRLGLPLYSVGFGVRLHTATNTIARVDVAYGRDGWRIVASASDPFRLKRLTRWTPPGPYVW